jgi:hypothetical protein
MVEEAVFRHLLTNLSAQSKPPYVRADEQSEWNQRQREQITANKQ